MAETVFILGAGASAESGGPLMGNFMSVASDVHRRTNDTIYHGTHDIVLDALEKLNVVSSKASLDFDNIELFLGAVEMASIAGGFPGYEGKSLQDLRGTIMKFIARTVELSIGYRFEGGQIKPNDQYERFIKLLTNIQKKELGRSFAILTFNYDLNLDYTLHFHGYNYDDGLSKSKKNLRLLKMHGSLNWTNCTNCKKIFPLTLKGGFGNVGPGIKEGSILHFNISEKVGRLEKQNCCDSFNPSLNPVIVPPTWNKAMYHEGIDVIWKEARKELSDAENIVIMGYSLPPSDEFFKHLYGLGTIGKKRLKNIYVFDPDSDVGDRFRDIIPLAIHNKFHYKNFKFSRAVGELHKLLPDF